MSDKKDESQQSRPAKGWFDSFVDVQSEFLRQAAASQSDALRLILGPLQGLTRFNAIFKTTVQSGGRISIPEAEREIVGIGEGDLVQVIVIPLRKRGGEEKVREGSPS